MNQKKKRDYVEDFLLGAGIAPSLKGFEALTEAVLLAVKQPKIMDAVTKELYPAIAKKLGVSWHVVERRIRHAIGVCFDSEGWQAIVRVLKVPPRINSGKYSNSEFISVVALLVRREFDE